MANSMVNRGDQAILETLSVRSDISSASSVVLSHHRSALADLSSSANALKEEMRSLAVELSSSLGELKELLCGQEALLGCLKATVKSSIEELKSLSVCLPEETSSLRHMVTTTETPLHPSNIADERSECVDGMLRRTLVVHGGYEGLRLVRKLYERLYDEDVVTKCFLKYLRGESRFVVKVDCDYITIERMKETFVELDGTERSGSEWYSFFDFSTNTVYLGAKVDDDWSEGFVAGMFANVLAQMSLHIAFNNGGKPYEGGDNLRKTEFKRALEEAEEKKRNRGDELHPLIRVALDYKTQTARESHLAVCVPAIIALHGSKKGTRNLQEQVPRLIDYFKEHVGTTLLAMARMLSPAAPLIYSVTPHRPSIMAEERRECVDGMMTRTEVEYGGEEGVKRIRKLYERLYDEDVVTKCLLKFLHKESRFVAKVDCDSYRIARMKETVVDLDGREWSGNDWYSFAEFSTCTVYLGAKADGVWKERYVAGWFAEVLAQMSLQLCFDNRGKPYEGGDSEHETEWKSALKEAEDKERQRGHRLYLLIWLIRLVFFWKPQTARESFLAASVPTIIAENGSNKGTRRLREQAPRLLHYFKEHVVATLLAKAEEPLQLQQRSHGRSGGIRSLRRKIQNFLQKTFLIILVVVFFFYGYYPLESYLHFLYMTICGRIDVIKFVVKQFWGTCVI